MLKISSLIREDREFSSAMECLAEAYRRATPLPIVINGLAGGATLAFLNEAVGEALAVSGAPVLVITPTEEERARVAAYLAPDHGAVEFKPRYPVLHNISASHDVERERLSVLSSILSGRARVIVTTPPAALSLTIPPELLSALSLELYVGLEISPDNLASRLAALGFAPVESVEGRGQFARRGGIVDFFGADMDLAVRCEFFGDEVDRLSYFDPLSQRTVDNADRISMLPAREVVVDDSARAKMLAEIDRLLSGNGLSDEMRARLGRERASVSAAGMMEFRDKYLPLIYRPASLFDYLTGRTILFNLGTSECREAAISHLRRLDNDVAGLISYGAMSKGASKLALTLNEYNEFLDNALTVHVNSFAGGVGGLRLSGLFGFRSRPTVSYGENISMLVEDLVGLSRAGYRTILVSDSTAAAEELIDTLADLGVAALLVDKNGENDPKFDTGAGIDAKNPPSATAKPTAKATAGGDKSSLKLPAGGVGATAKSPADMTESADDSTEFNISRAPSGVWVTVGSHDGFDLISPRIAVLSMAHPTGKAVMSHRRKQSVSRRAGGVKRLMSHAELVPGDYVVHATYGIGLFEGMEAVTVDGVTRDYISIRYAGTDMLFVPCERLDVLGKYIGERDKDGKVKLSKMGGGDWNRAKSKARAATKELAKKLVQLYAERQRRAGFAFPKQSELEDKFEAEFEYEPTESQLAAINDIKADMIRPVPMNRLLCGDVGFGKTEVALRAAFKAILGGKQVAILVPTTILALQHYQTALSRMRGYAVTVEMLSRFRKPKERREIIERTRRGRVDILIGTHAMISKNVEFRDLGLLIIDEEQRFGVAQKERLREMAVNVDTLMLSATPIPRTLNMAMSGISDISVLDEAPGDRRPVQTYVMEHDADMIYDAIRRELSRRGQVLYLYNRIEDIDLVAGRVQEAIPEARVAYAHGQMDKEELEDIWQYLVRGEIDVLVCTTIIETGVDLPNANTLIIENADRFGLSQLHQIRGRVGRSERQAYAYLTYRPGKSLSEVAEKRLETIRDFAEFGAGFKIALRDMEIRGVGNLLGPEQHGYIESVGYNLYVKLLNEAIIEERGDARPERFEATVAITISAHIPESYVPSAATRMEIYKKIALIETAADRMDMLDELTDRFGDPPRAVVRLVDVALIKALAERARIRKVEARDGRLTFVTDKPRLDLWSEVFAAYPQMSMLGVGTPLVVYKLRRGEEPTDAAVRVLVKYTEILSSDEAQGG